MWFKPMLMLAIFSSLGGCQAMRVRESAAELSRTLPDLQQQQVLDNIARIAANPTALPYYSLPNTSTAQIARTVQAKGLLKNKLSNFTFVVELWNNSIRHGIARV